MTDRPIIFSGPMIRALIEGRKTQTRRIVKVPGIMGGRYPILPPEEAIELEGAEFRSGVFHYASTGALSGPYRLPASVGDRLWARETWRVSPDACEGWPPDQVPCRGWIDYRAGGHEEQAAPSFSHLLDAFGRKVDVDWDCLPDTWRPSIFMPRWASRLTLIVEGVRVERLNDIGEADAIAEGIEKVGRHGGEPLWKNYGDGPTAAFVCPIKSYRLLWNNLHGPNAWAANPWVVALTFRVIRENIDGVPA